MALFCAKLDFFQCKCNQANLPARLNAKKEDQCFEKSIEKSFEKVQNNRQRAQGHAVSVREDRCSGPRMEARRKEALETPSTPTDPVLLTQRRGALCPPLSRDARG